MMTKGKIELEIQLQVKVSLAWKLCLIAIPSSHQNKVKKNNNSVLSVRFEVGVSLLLAPGRADKRDPFSSNGTCRNTASDSQESTRRSSGGNQVLLKALQLVRMGLEYCIIWQGYVSMWSGLWKDPSRNLAFKTCPTTYY